MFSGCGGLYSARKSWTIGAASFDVPWQSDMESWLRFLRHRDKWQLRPIQARISLERKEIYDEAIMYSAAGHAAGGVHHDYPWRRTMQHPHRVAV
jgi:hypothetical protein